MSLPTASAIRDALGLWVGLAGLGAFHGLNPGMGWLFALALGLQQQSGQAVWAALLPIAIGHAASLALVAGLLGAAGALLPQETLRLLGALTLLGFGLYKAFTYYRHPRWVGMRVGPRDLCRWSFLMATAHGGGPDGHAASDRDRRRVRPDGDAIPGPAPAPRVRRIRGGRRSASRLGRGARRIRGPARLGARDRPPHAGDVADDGGIASTST